MQQSELGCCGGPFAISAVRGAYPGCPPVVTPGLRRKHSCPGCASPGRLLGCRLPGPWPPPQKRSLHSSSGLNRSPHVGLVVLTRRRAHTAPALGSCRLVLACRGALVSPVVASLGCRLAAGESVRPPPYSPALPPCHTRCHPAHGQLSARLHMAVRAYLRHACCRGHRLPASPSWDRIWSSDIDKAVGPLTPTPRAPYLRP